MNSIQSSKQHDKDCQISVDRDDGRNITCMCLCLFIYSPVWQGLTPAALAPGSR